MKPPLDATVYVVDDDAGARQAVCFLLESHGLHVAGFPSAADFLQRYEPNSPGCLVLDQRMPGMTGLELQRRMIEEGITLPIIMVTGHGDVATCAQAFRFGAVDFIEKPVNDSLLISRIRQAIARDALTRGPGAAAANLQARLPLLTPREREVMDRLVAGKSMKQISLEFDISVQTTSKHRMKILEKLRVSNDIELVKLFVNPAAAPAL